MLTGSMDKTCKVWNADSGECVQTLRDHNDEVLDVGFSLAGGMIVTVSADGACAVCFMSVC